MKKRIIQDESPTFLDIVETVQKIDSSKRKYISEVCRLIKILLLAPSTNANSEWMFSASKRNKT